MKPLPPYKKYFDVTTPEERELGFQVLHKEFDNYGGDILVDVETTIVKLIRDGKQYGCWAIGNPAEVKEGLKAACLSALQYDDTHPSTEDKPE